MKYCRDGIQVKDEDGNVLGNSAAAGKRAVAQVFRIICNCQSLILLLGVFVSRSYIFTGADYPSVCYVRFRPH